MTQINYSQWNYDTVLALFKERENYCGKPWYKIQYFCDTFLIRMTKNTLINGYKDHIEITTPVKTSYMAETETFIYYEDLEDIRITHIPLEIDFKLRGIKTHFRVETPIKWDWGFDIKSLPVYCEERYNEMIK